MWATPTLGGQLDRDRRIDWLRGVMVWDTGSSESGTVSDSESQMTETGDRDNARLSPD